MGLGVPIVTIPCLPESFACHPAFSKNMTLLKECSVYVLYDSRKYPPMNNIPWEVILDTLRKATTKYPLQREKEEVH